jgi:hypothetical protein
MVIIVESEEFLPCKLHAVVHDYRVRDPKAVDDVREEFDDLFTPDLRDRSSLYPLGELVYSDKQVCIALGRLLEGPD